MDAVLSRRLKEICETNLHVMNFANGIVDRAELQIDIVAVNLTAAKIDRYVGQRLDLFRRCWIARAVAGCSAMTMT